MKIYLAVDILGGQVVHGVKGNRKEYKPFEGGLSSALIPRDYIREMKARNIYLADLDKIEGHGNNDETIIACGEISSQIDSVILNRGIRVPESRLRSPDKKYREWTDKLEYVISSETCEGDQSAFSTCEYFSQVIRNGITMPKGEKPEDAFAAAADWDFEGAVVMNLSSVGAEDSMGGLNVESIRDSYPRSRKMLYGGGVNSVKDLNRLYDAGYDGAIIATSIHKKRIPAEILYNGDYKGDYDD